MKRGITRIYDSVLAVIILITALITTLGFVGTFAADQRSGELEELATNLMICLERKGLLSPMVFNQEYERLEGLISQMLPPNVGFRLSVYTCEWNQLWSIEHQFGIGRASSGLIFLSGHMGNAEPRIVILSLTR